MVLSPQENVQYLVVCRGSRATARVAEMLHFKVQHHTTLRGSKRRSWLIGRAEPLFSKIMPVWVAVSNQGEFSRSYPAFDLFLASEGITNLWKRLGMNQSIDVVSGCEARDQPMSMLIHAPGEVARHSGVKRSRTVRHDVDPVRFHSGLVMSRRPRRRRQWSDTETVPCSVPRPCTGVMVRHDRALAASRLQAAFVLNHRDSSPAGSE